MTEPGLIVWCDRVTGWLLAFMIVFAPWAFGTTQPWSVWTMNAAGYLLGVLLTIKMLARRKSNNGSPCARNSAAVALAMITAGLLAWCLVSAANAASTYIIAEWRFEPRQHVAWLPHSFDAAASWQAFWDYLALACVFWSARDWLLNEEGAHSRGVPTRWRRLLWVLCLNGAVLALEGIFQRTSGTANLLWIMPTRVNRSAESQFGPYAYRANAAQYLNLIWPVALGFWWWLAGERVSDTKRRGLRHVLLPCAVVMAAASMFSLSRGGAAVAAGLLLGLCALFALERGAPLSLRLGVVLLGIAVMGMAIYMSWDSLGKRFAESAENPLRGRAEIYAQAGQMARDYPWFGTGPGSFGWLYQMYRQTPEDYWPAQLHNDWLEFRITFGRIGMGLMLAALLLACTSWLWARGVPAKRSFVLAILLALGGCLIHARFDFPFQIYSIEFLFLLLCAVVFSASRRRRTHFAP